MIDRQVADCEVLSRGTDGFDVKLLPGGTKAFLPIGHLSDHPGNWNMLWKVYGVGDVIKNVAVWKIKSYVVSFMKFVSLHMTNLCIILWNSH